ncbi:hypothetical protein V6Z12_A01G105400 [Gossypium hirsutum]
MLIRYSIQVQEPQTTSLMMFQISIMLLNTQFKKEGN